MHWEFLGSTGILVASHCQNDIYLTPGGTPLNPNIGDIRLIVQATNMGQMAIIYAELWTVAGWQAMNMPSHLVVQDVMANVPQVAQQLLPRHWLTNQAILNNVPFVLGYTLVWSHTVIISGASINYIPHRPRGDNDAYMPARNPDPNPVPCVRIRWARQRSEYRQGLR
ncbi:hypothetical protein DFH07DRAFT_959251 [Mycena maculata]|uniref:Uncharacterized protein n=1 Tax=Mycena maculata TaxID=230809 RepID=A0AAD7J5P4_9AGAR|nr:hypothetical protein DFH07DRAFT_959251 [Mycena maculata]